MTIIVEPIDGAELDRLVTALLNVTGSVHQIVEAEMEDPLAGGLEVIGRSADRVRAALSIVAEHRDDDALRPMTEFLAVVTMLIAGEGGFEEAFEIGGFD